jgi:hypothetical protein
MFTYLGLRSLTVMCSITTQHTWLHASFALISELAALPRRQSFSSTPTSSKKNLGLGLSVQKTILNWGLR